MRLRLPWQKEGTTPAPVAAAPSTCAHPRVEVEMHGTVIKRRWCAVCGQELPVAERSAES